MFGNVNFAPLVFQRVQCERVWSPAHLQASFCAGYVVSLQIYTLCTSFERYSVAEVEGGSRSHHTVSVLPEY